MRRETLFNATSKIITDLEKSGLKKMIEIGVDKIHRATSKDDQVSWVSLDIFQKYSLLTSNYSNAEEKILKILGIYNLSSPDFWTMLIQYIDPDSIWKAHQNILFVSEQLPKLLQLIEQEYIEEAKTQDGTKSHELVGKTLLTVILVEDKGQFSSPARLVYILEAVSNLYSVLATLDGLTDTDLSVLACDSGSDKSFDFLGADKIIAELRLLIISIWDRRVFNRQRHVSQCLLLIAESLPIIERIHELKESGALGQEQAELLKRKAIDGATKFLESGAIISEMDHEAIQSPRTLMRPEPKLITGPIEQGSHSEGKNSVITDDDDMSEEDIAELERLKAKQKNRKLPPKTE